MSKNRKMALLLAMALLGALFVFLWLPRIPQDPAYHHFADIRRFWGIPNAANVLSSLPFVWVGIWGMNSLWQNSRTNARSLRWAFFVAVTLTGFGSMIYHRLPDNNNLVWDRVPMAVMFMTLCLIIIADRISSRVALKLFLPMVSAGVLCVFYWWFGEMRGSGDLRPYVLVSILPLLLIPATIILLPSGTISNRNTWTGLCWYALAKLLEFLDKPLYEWTGSVVSGHTLKHVCAAVAVYCLFRKNRLMSHVSSRTF